jgi:hypothetical protein
MTEAGKKKNLRRNNMTGDRCDICGSDLGHRINCPKGSCFTKDGVIGGPATNRDRHLKGVNK